MLQLSKGIIYTLPLATCILGAAMLKCFAKAINYAHKSFIMLTPVADFIKTLGSQVFKDFEP
jgi:hypothetical protein